ncbi:ATP-dependent RNA helicase ddx54 [Orobanche hederae]
MSDGEFETLGLSSNIIQGCKANGFTHPYTIHQETIPPILSGKDVILVAPSCSARTLSFLAPLLDSLNQKHHKPMRALILTPTKDFAHDILKLVRVLAQFTGLRIGLLVCDNDMESLFEELTLQNPDVLIATPDADCLLSLGNEKHLRQILSHINESHQTLLFTNTLPSALVNFVKSISQHPQMVRHFDTITSILKLVFFTLSGEEKTVALLYLIKERIRSNERTLIFVPTRYHAEFLNLLFTEQGIKPSVCYGDMGREARMVQVSRFRSGENMLLITTDTASNEMGTLAVDNIINWDFPCSPEHFLSRVRATVGAVQPGTVFFFVTRGNILHVLDFRIFLLKEMIAAPTEEQITQHGNTLEVVSEVDQADERRKIFYGCLPGIVVDSYADEVQKILDASPKLKSMERSCC